MNGVTVGQYVPGYSFLHRLDPRVKLVVNIIFIALVFTAQHFISLGAILFLAIFAFFLSPLRPRQLLRMMIPVIFIGVFLFLINLFVIKSSESTSDIFTPVVWWKITISETALIRTLLLMLRVYTMVIVTTLLISTTKPSALTRSIEDLMLPLKFIKVPVHIIAMIISIALRFIPTLLEEAQRIMKSQASRGVDFKNGTVTAKMRSLITLIVPLFVAAFAKAEDLGNAMEVRGYDPYAKRVRYRTYVPGWRDAILATITIGLIVYIALVFNGVIIMPYWV